MTLPFLYSDEDAEAFLDDLLETPDGWYRFVEQHRAWGFDDVDAVAMIRDRSKGKYQPHSAHMVAMYEAQKPRPSYGEAHREIRERGQAA